MVYIQRPGIREGNYTTWAYKWQKSITGGLSGSEYMATMMDAKHNILFLLWKDNNNNDRLGSYKLSDGSVIYESPALSDYTCDTPDVGVGGGINIGLAGLRWRGAARSLQSYLLILRNDAHTIEVWRYPGTIALWSHSIRAEVAAAKAETAEMEITGRYILVNTGSAKEKLILYEGG